MKDQTDICAHRSGSNAHSFLANLHVSGRKRSQRERIYVQLRDFGPATCEELSLGLAMRYTSVSARLAELKADRFVTPSGQERKTTGGEWASVMRAVSESEREILIRGTRRYSEKQGALFL
jgi:hypothetical protein